MKKNNGTDFIKLEQQLKLRRYLSNLIVNPKNRINLESIIFSLELTGLLSATINYEMSPFFPTLLIGLNAGKCISEIQIEQKKAMRDVEYELQDYIRKTDIYQQTYFTYQNYLDTMSNFLNSMINTKNSTELALFYQEMLDHGILSNIHHHSYDMESTKYNFKLRYQISKYELDELVGCCVFTGKSVCRHISSLLTDIEQRVGNDANNLCVISLDQYEGIETFTALVKQYHMNLKANHQITVLQDKNQNYFGYDPTNNFFLQFDARLMKDNQYTSGHTVPLKTGEKQDIHYLIKYDNNPNIPMKVFDYNRMKSFTPETYNELIEVKKNIKQLYMDRKREVETFYHDTKEDLNMIATNMNEMIPKQIVKTLVLK